MRCSACNGIGGMWVKGFLPVLGRKYTYWERCDLCKGRGESWHSPRVQVVRRSRRFRRFRRVRTRA